MYIIYYIDHVIVKAKVCFIMKKPEVAILMSTYNGTEFLEEQIQSIIDQSFTNWELLIRDDGSIDQTVSIIKKYCSIDTRIHLIKSTKNLGTVSSFFYLLEQADADYYMFADQDDVWKKNKVELTVNKMKNILDQNIPTCVYSNLTVVDECLNEKGQLLTNNWQSFPYLLFTNNVFGCTMAINQSLKSKVLFNDLNIDNIYMHDWWLALLAAAFGKVLYIPESTILYRQHGSNQVGASKKNVLSFTKRIINPERDRTALKRTMKLAHELMIEYPLSSFNDIDRSYIVNYGSLFKLSTFWHNLKLVVKQPPKSVHPTKEFFYAFLICVFHKDYLEDN